MACTEHPMFYNGNCRACADEYQAEYGRLMPFGGWDKNSPVHTCIDNNHAPCLVPECSEQDKG